MDTTTASGELLFHVFGALAQYERALTRERVMAGLTAARRRNKAGLEIPVEFLTHVSPLGWEHINLTGEYRWRVPIIHVRGGNA